MAISNMEQLVGVNDKRMDFRVVGQRNLPGKVSYALATGVAKFGIDYTFPNMLFGKFLRSPYANAYVKIKDISKALAIPGVVDVVVWDDPDIVKLGGGGFGPSRPWLDDYADAEGAEVGAIVVAENEDICDLGLKALELEWTVLPHIVDVEKAHANNATMPTIRPSTMNFGGGMFDAAPAKPKENNVSFADTIQGDVDAEFAVTKPENIIEYRLQLPTFASHIPNPPSSVAYWFDDPYHPSSKSLRVEGAVQRRDSVGSMYGVSNEMTVQEGIFQGGKYCDWGMRRSQEIAPLLAKRTDRPVRVADEREDTFGFLMNERFLYLKIAHTDEGLITAIDDFSIADGGMQGNSSFGTANDQGYGPYYTFKCLNIRQHMETVDSNRGKMFLSGQHCPFNWDSGTMAIYLIAEKLGKDPIDIMRLNLHGPTSQEDPNPVLSFEEISKAGKEMMDWDWHATGARTLPDGRKHGAAVRYQMCPRHAFSGYNCKLELRGGKVHLPTQGPVTGIYAVECNAMVVAEELGLEYDDIIVDFDWRERFTPVGGGSDGSTASSWAMKECANILKEKILEATINQLKNPPAPSMFGGFGGFGGPPQPDPFEGVTSADELDLANGMVVLKSDPTKGKPLARAVSANIFATFEGRPPAAIWSLGMGKMLDTMNMVFTEVAVDEDTGEVEILRFGVAIDPGKVLRMTSLESQCDQVMYFSQVCQTLSEYVYDERTGVQLTNNMIDYRWVTPLDAAPVDHAIVESRSGNAAYGASGISHSMANTHLVIIAIHNAIGVWVDPPATPNKILAAMGKA
ncbi:MAG: molybdopterin-dependent oxidoreductase [Oscillospiraceae bacterium]|jgi:CO/xanthine dehydrogenase Mo-binding subunit|nr:molybdopterin-dependent oxidoreductase [Oscillospiraceae bacterium]